jgi:hypothetical protein
MAQIIGNNSNVSVVGPSLTGEYIPSIDNPQKRNGLGIVTPWGGGTALQTSVSSGNTGVNISEQNEISQLKDLILSRPTGDNISYSLEGIIGPPGPPGPAGPAGLPSPAALSALTGGVDIPVRILDDGTTPATPTGLVATAMVEAIMLEWTSNSEPDMDHYEVWRNTTDDSASATLVSSAYQTLLVDGDKAPTQAYYYWVKAVDHLGNTSAFSSSVNATPSTQSTAGPLSLKISGTITPDTALGNYNNIGTHNSKDCYANADGWKIWWDSTDSDWYISEVLGTAGSDYWSKADDPVVGDYTNGGTAIGTATIAQGGGPWDTADLVDGAVTEGKLAAASVSAAKTSIAAINSTTGALNANAVGATQIQANAITEAKILADAVTATKIAVAGLDGTTGKVAVNHIETNMIQAAAITAEKISAGAITSGKIQTLNFIVTAGVWDDDSPAPDSISWTGCKVAYNGTEHTITDGSTTDKFIYWRASKCTISGTLSPNVVGTFYYAGVYATKDYYKNMTGAYHLYWSTGLNAWIINKTLGGPAGTYSWIGGADLEGEYAPNGMATGTATVVNTVVAPSTEFTTSATLPTLDDDEFIVAQNLSGAHLLVWNSTTVDGGRIRTGSVTATQIQASTITANELATNSVTSDKILADAVTASKINVVGLDGTTGRIVVADATDANTITGAINSHATTIIEPGKVLISGTTKLSDWSSGVDATYVDGGKIYTNSITADQIAAGTITGTQIADGTVTTDKILTVDAAKILLSGTTYLSNWRNGSDVTKIDGGKIYTGSITADKIAANSITASQMAVDSIVATNIVADSITTAKLNNSAVTTAKLDTNAASVPVSAYTAGSLTCYRSATTTVQSVGITATGRPITINWMWSEVNAGATRQIRLYRGGTEIYNSGSMAGAVFQGINSGSFQDTPSAGSVTYYLKITNVQANQDIIVTARMLCVVENKK